jgi:nicotinate-nucleotide pyrophosphorylase
VLLLQDNHIAAAGGITAAVQRAQSYLKDREMSMGIEVRMRYRSIA